MEDGNRKNSALCLKRPFNIDDYLVARADLFEYIVYRTRWDAVAFEIDESYLLESIHDFFGRLPLLRERVCMSIFAKVDQGDPKSLVRPSVLRKKSQQFNRKILAKCKARDTNKGETSQTSTMNMQYTTVGRPESKSHCARVWRTVCLQSAASTSLETAEHLTAANPHNIRPLTPFPRTTKCIRHGPLQ
jgi:hypothetical protein